MEVSKYSASLRRISPFGTEPLRQAVPLEVLNPSARRTLEISVPFLEHRKRSRSRKISKTPFSISEIGNIIEPPHYEEE